MERSQLSPKPVSSLNTSINQTTTARHGLHQLFTPTHQQLAPAEALNNQFNMKSVHTVLEIYLGGPNNIFTEIKYSTRL